MVVISGTSTVSFMDFMWTGKLYVPIELKHANRIGLPSCNVRQSKDCSHFHSFFYKFVPMHTKKSKQISTNMTVDLWSHLVQCVNLINHSTDNFHRIVNSHKKKILRLGLKGKHRYRTIQILQNYARHPDRSSAVMIFTNTLNNRNFARHLLPQIA